MIVDGNFLSKLLAQSVNVRYGIHDKLVNKTSEYKIALILKGLTAII